jgi:hypothetical protein
LEAVSGTDQLSTITSNTVSNSAGWSPLAWILVGWASMLLAMAVWQMNMHTMSSGGSLDSPQTQPLVNQPYG